MPNRRLLYLGAALAALLPPLMFPEVIFQGQSFYFVDLSGLHYPLRVLSTNFWKAGEWPLWNPYSWNGFPLLAENQVGPLSPLNAFFLLPIPPYQALNLLILFHMAVACLGAFALARQTGVRAGSALLAGLAYAGGGYIMAQLVNLNIMIGSAWAPLIFALLLRAMERRRAGFALLAGLVLALQIYSSHPQVSYYTLSVLGIFTLYGTLLRRKAAGQNLWRAALACGGYLSLTVLVAVGLSAPQLLMGIELLTLSRRAQGLASEAQTLLSMPPTGLLTLIFPRLFQVPTVAWRTTGAYDEFHFYIGLISLAAAGLAVLRKNQLIVRFALLMLAASVLLALGRFTPVYDIVSHLPLVSLFRVPARWLFVSAIALIILVAHGADAVFDLLSDEARRPQAARIARTFAILIVALSLTVPVAMLVRPPDAAQLAVEDIFSIERNSTRTQAVARLLPEALVFAGLAGAAVVTFRLLAWRRRVHAFAVAAIAIACVDLFLAGGTVTKAPAYWDEGRPLIDFIQQNGAFDRVFSTGGYFDVVSRLGDQMPSSAGVYASSGESNPQFGLQRTEDMLTQVPFDEYLRLGGTRWLILPKNMPRLVDRMLKLALPISAQLPVVWESDQVVVFATRNPLPRVYISYAALRAASPPEAIALLRSGRFDAQSAVVLESATTGLPETGAPVTAVMPSSYAAMYVRLEANLARDGVLVLTDSYYPGWVARVDGVDQPILRANYLFRGVLLPAGQHVVEFRYEPVLFQIGLLAAGTTGVLMAVYALMAFRKARKGINAV